MEIRAVLLQYCVDSLSKLDLDPCNILDPRFSKTLRIESRGEFVDVRGRLRNFCGLLRKFESIEKGYLARSIFHTTELDYTVGT